MSSSLPRVGILGIPPVALLPFIRDAGFEVVALWDPNNNQESEAKFAAKSNLNIEIEVASYEDEVILHPEIGLLLIFCDPSYHAQIAVKALGIAKHVFVHPPASISPAQTQRMVQSASYYPNLTAVVGGLRCLPAAQEMRRLIEAKFLGDDDSPLHCDIRLTSPSLVASDAQSKFSWKCREDMGGGVLNQFGYALIDLGLIYLLQQRALRVHAVFRTMQRNTPHIKGIRHITADDVAQVLIETDRRDCLISLNLNTNFSQFSQELSITGSKGQLVLRNASLYGRQFNDNSLEEVFYLDTNNLPTSKAAKNSSSSSSVAPELPFVHLQGYSKMFDLLRTVFDQHDKAKGSNDDEGGNQAIDLLSSFEDALHVAEIIKAARDSSLNKAWVQVNKDN